LCFACHVNRQREEARLAWVSRVGPERQRGLSEGHLDLDQWPALGELRGNERSEGGERCTEVDVSRAGSHGMKINTSMSEKKNVQWICENVKIMNHCTS